MQLFSFRKMILKTTGLLILLTSFNAMAELQLTSVWQVDGLSNPESVTYDWVRDQYFVSNMAGDGLSGDGQGFISLISGNGELINKNWVTGLNAPKGLAIRGDTLFVASLTSGAALGDNGLQDLTSQVVAIDIETGAIVAEIPAPGAHLLNDTAVGPHGNVYVSDLGGNAIYRLQNGTFQPWLESLGLQDPNGLFVDSRNVYVASFGLLSDPDTGVYDFDNPLGFPKKVDVRSKEITNLNNSTPLGLLDGITAFRFRTWLVTNKTDFLLQLLNRRGEVITSTMLAGDPADLTYVPSQRLVVIPFASNGDTNLTSDAVVAYRIGFGY